MSIIIAERVKRTRFIRRRGVQINAWYYYVVSVGSCRCIGKFRRTVIILFTMTEKAAERIVKKQR